MKRYFSLLLAMRMLTVQLSASAQAAISDMDSIVSPGASLSLISKQFSFTEGPAADRKGNIYFTDQPNNRIWKYGIDGRLSLFMDSAGRSNGMYFDKKGDLITCADEKDELWAISPDKKVTVLLTNFMGHRFNGPNDCWVAPGGGIYFTDPYYQRDYWTRTQSEIEGEKVYFLPKDGTAAIAVAGDIEKPNGIVGTPDGKYLYVADIKANKTYRYRIAKDGKLINKELFVPQGSDGMTLDEDGRLYLTGNGVTVYDAAGGKVAQISVPSKWTANVCFGGKDKRTLFITASESIYTLSMKVRGVE